MIHILSLLFLLVTVLFAQKAPVYNIHGFSPKLDANMSLFLGKWRNDTIGPIRDGKYGNVIVNVPSGTKTIALTFDDSPDEKITGMVLDILKEKKVQAAFFMIGSPMNDLNATAVKRASDEGHLVLNHTFTHPHLSKLTSEQIKSELDRCSVRIEEITGHYPLLVRPPYGDLDPKVAETIRVSGYQAILWSLDSLDWAVKIPDEITDNILTQVRRGDIILMHASVSNHATVESLRNTIDRLRGEGYRFERLDRLLGIPAYR